MGFFHRCAHRIYAPILQTPAIENHKRETSSATEPITFGKENLSISSHIKFSETF